MKRITIVIVLLACGFLAAGTPLSAQTATPAAPAASSTDWFTGKATLLLLGRDDVESSKFEEYRVVPKGVSMPVFTLQGSQGGKDFALFGQNVSQKDQRYFGYASAGWFGVTYDYNQIPHNMGNNGRTLFAETSPGVWNMNATARKALGDAVDAVPAASRTYPFYADLLAPTIAAANSLDISGLRQRGDVKFDLTQGLPFDVSFSYMREVKTGFRGASGGDILGVVTSAVDVRETMNEVTRTTASAAPTTSRSGTCTRRSTATSTTTASTRSSSTTRSGPPTWPTCRPRSPAGRRRRASARRPTTRPAASPLAACSSSRARRASSPTSRSTRGRRTRRSCPTRSTRPSSRRQARLRTASPRSSRSRLTGRSRRRPSSSTFSSRPVRGLGIRARYRLYDQQNKTNMWVITGDVSGSPDRSWSRRHADRRRAVRPRDGQSLQQQDVAVRGPGQLRLR